MSKKWGVLSEANKYSKKIRELDGVTSRILRMERNVDKSFDGKCDDALSSELRGCRSNVRVLQGKISNTEKSLRNLAKRIEEYEERKRREEEAKRKKEKEKNKKGD